MRNLGLFIWLMFLLTGCGEGMAFPINPTVWIGHFSGRRFLERIYRYTTSQETNLTMDIQE